VAPRAERLDLDDKQKRLVDLGRVEVEIADDEQVGVHLWSIGQPDVHRSAMPLRVWTAWTKPSLGPVEEDARPTPRSSPPRRSGGSEIQTRDTSPRRRRGAG
jgi:hypothetical protein